MFLYIRRGSSDTDTASTACFRLRATDSSMERVTGSSPTTRVRTGGGAYSAFRSLTAFLALYNQLRQIGKQEKIAALLELYARDFSDWLDSVQREGSVHG